MTEPKKGDRIKVSFEGTVYYAAADELGVNLDSGKSIYLETGTTLTEAMTIEILEPPKVPANADVIRWVYPTVVHGHEEYLYRYANRYGHPANGVWTVTDVGNLDTEHLLEKIGDANVEVLKELER